jgi:O-succinylbenzoic acid--CoA ligase
MDINYSKASEKERMAFEEFLRVWNGEKDVIPVKTSGSTGTPKEINLQKRDMISSANQTLNFLDLKGGGSSLICLSMDTIAGKMMAVRSIVGNLRVHLSPVNSIPLLNLQDEIDLCAMVPLQLETELKKNPTKLKLIKHLLIGGGPVSADLEQRVTEAGVSFWHTYGMTETISHVALRRAGKNGEPHFTALPGITFSEDNGKLIIHYPAIGIDQLKTNDLVDLISSISFRYIGRADFIINSGGIKFNPEELENSIASIMQVKYFFGGVSDKILGQKIVLFIEGIDTIIPQNKDLELLLPRYAVPKEIIRLTSFVRTESGKINRIESLKLYR